MSEFIGKWLPQESIGNQFLQECENIISNIDTFNTFKQNIIFRQVIGNDVLSKTISDILYNNIENNNFIIDNINLYKTNDIYGSPILYSYPKTGNISPGTLYFLNILQSLNQYFNDISNFNIIEIGSGYGGQAKIILDSGIKSYSVVDVKQTLSLCKYYLQLFNYKNINFYTSENIQKKSYDLVISNWCLSEFDEVGITYYIENIIQYCNNGFFLMNMWDSRKEFLLEKLKLYFSDIQIYPEYPKTHQNDNWLLVIKK